ncbi:hypothetical protein RchiOBHm_Chr4g0406931 [Rosa chinensis]|uniref:Uncharacterized protein n=1 Tax=Rosa chinensis TaxID=74649 RepID=A0A2P6QUF7_ROSCH|nr:hypothetical protein RchiOBHm_Chr4g0406931 [Rosa chinensis]
MMRVFIFIFLSSLFLIQSHPQNDLINKYPNITSRVKKNPPTHISLASGAKVDLDRRLHVRRKYQILMFSIKNKVK